jgi:hypothetical protein
MSHNPGLHALGSVLTSTFRRLDHLLKLSFAVTYRCNLQCRMCNIWRKPAPAKELDLAEIDAFLSRTRGLSWVGLTGGESFLRPDLPQIVEAVHRHCGESLLALHFATNGQLVDRIAGLLAELARMKRRWRPVFTVSFDGPREVHDEMRGRTGAWDRAVETLRLLKSTGGVSPGGFHVDPAQPAGVRRHLRRPRKRRRIQPQRHHRQHLSPLGFYYDNAGMPGLDRAWRRHRRNPAELGPRASPAAFLRDRTCRLYGRYTGTQREPRQLPRAVVPRLPRPRGRPLPLRHLPEAPHQRARDDRDLRGIVAVAGSHQPRPRVRPRTLPILLEPLRRLQFDGRLAAQGSDRVNSRPPHRPNSSASTRRLS